MTWIQTITYADSSGRLRQLYDRVKGPDDNVDNIMMAHSLRPHTMDGHMAIYKLCCTIPPILFQNGFWKPSACW